MLRYRLLLLIGCCILILSFQGCSWLSFKRTLPPESTQFVEVGRIVDVDRLNKGGKILIVPFVAGAGVEANKQLDRIALKIVQAIADDLEGQKPNFEILLQKNADEADFVIKGYITNIRESGILKRWILRTQKQNLSVKGRMIDARNGETIVIFSDTRQSKNKQKSFQDLGYMIGQSIARFIRSGVE